MPGMARRRRQPRSWSAARRSQRPAATSRAALTSAIARPALRSKDCRRADERVEAEAVVERAQVVVDGDGEAHALDGFVGGVAVVGLRAEEDPVAGELAYADEGGLAFDAEQAREDLAAGAGQSVQGAL